LLARLHAGGLSAERDLPSFLRMAGHRDNARLRLVRDHIGQLHQRARSWAAEVGQNTLAYLDLTFAFGLARLGETSLARELMNHAGERLQALDRSIKNEAERGVGPLLFDSFAYRIEQVLAGDSVSSPLPREYHELQAQLPSLTGYAVARYWSNTSILEPQAKADPYSKTLAQGEFAKEIAALPGYRDARILVDRVNRLLRMGASGKSKPVDRIPVLNESLPLAPRAGEAFTLSLLDQVIPAIDAVAQESHPNLNEKMYQLLERAIIQAGHFGRTGQVQQFVSFFVKLIKTSDRLPLPYIGRLAGQSLRSLRRLGLLSELQTLLTVLEAAVLGGKSLASVKQLTGPAWTHSVQILLYLAGAWLQGDTPEKATPILDEGRRYLFRDERGASPERPLPIDYMKVAVAYATALGQTDPLFSLPRFDEFFGRLDKIPNSMTSSKHYSLLHLNLVEAVVLAVASDELAIGPEARRWLDEDEYLVRRRIHADMDAARSGAGW
jgi:hypothetical protein